MNLDHKDNTFTLDWDICGVGEFQRRIKEILNLPEVVGLRWRTSARGGYHVKVQLLHKEYVLPYRRRFADDGRRIVNDLLNRPRHIHDILWDTKNVHGIKWTAGEWHDMTKHTCNCLNCTCYYEGQCTQNDCVCCTHLQSLDAMGVFENEIS